MIQDKAMLVILSISMWTARKYDKTVSKEIDDLHQAQDAGRYNKLLIDNDAMKHITSLAGDIRTYHYKVTLPWLDNGTRLLPSALYFDYCKQMETFKKQFDISVEHFISEYDGHKDAAFQTLGSMFKDSDYPEKESLRNKFSFETTFLPVPSEDDFRIELNNAEMEKIKHDLEKSTAKLTEASVTALWTRLKGVVTSLHAKLSDENAIFRNSLIGNIYELCHILPDLNITQDEGINTLSKEVMELLDGIGADTLRKDKKVRKEIAIESKSILDKMNGYANFTAEV
jgi:hypothetical protein